MVNSELIKFIENAPDTVITLVTGEKIVVLETAEEVMSRIVEYRRQASRRAGGQSSLKTIPSVRRSIPSARGIRRQPKSLSIRPKTRSKGI